MRLVFIINSASEDPCLILHVDSSVIATGIANLEWAVLPNGRSVAAIPLDATQSTICSLDLRNEVSALHRKVFPVPPYPLRKKNPPSILKQKNND